MSEFGSAIRLAAAVRVSKFAIVGLTCALFQLGINAVLVGGGLLELASYVISFLLSAQLNYLLSDRFTWANRRGTHLNGPLVRWAGFNLSVVGALVVSTAAFVVLNHFLANSLAVLGGIAAGAVLTFFVGDRLVFAGHRLGMGSAPPRTGHDQDNRQLTSSAALQERHQPLRDPEAAEVELRSVLGRGVALFLPAYNEAANLPVVVGQSVAALQQLASRRLQSDHRRRRKRG